MFHSVLSSSEGLISVGSRPKLRLSSNTFWDAFLTSTTLHADPASLIIIFEWPNLLGSTSIRTNFVSFLFLMSFFFECGEFSMLSSPTCGVICPSYIVWNYLFCTSWLTFWVWLVWFILKFLKSFIIKFHCKLYIIRKIFERIL